MIQSLDKGLRLLIGIVEAPHPMRLPEIAERYAMDRASAYRFLATLEASGLVHKDAAEKTYAPGPRLMRWLLSATPERLLVDAARPELETLAEGTGQTANLGVFSNGAVLLADSVRSSEVVAVCSEAGSVVPVHCTAVGKAIAAFLDERERRALVARCALDRRTERTIVTSAALLAELDRVRARGTASDHGENYELVTCIAAPVLDERGRPVCAVGVSGITSLYEGDPALFEATERAVHAAVERIGRRLVHAVAGEPETEDA